MSTPGNAAPAPVQQVDLRAVVDALFARLNGKERETQSISTGGPTVLVIAFEEGGQLKEHSADGVVLIQALRGSVTVSVVGSATTVESGQVLILQPGARHDVQAHARAAVMVTISR